MSGPEPVLVGSPAAEIPAYAECVTGYRLWTPRDGRLWPTGEGRTPWRPGVNDARCLHVDGAGGAHAAPEANCTCGLYAWREPWPQWAEDPRLRTGALVCGAVALWGRIEVHATGFRAEHACVVALAHPFGINVRALGALQPVAARYEVEIVALDELTRAAASFGSPLPAHVGLVGESPPGAAITFDAPAEAAVGEVAVGEVAVGEVAVAEMPVGDETPGPEAGHMPLPAHAGRTLLLLVGVIAATIASLLVFDRRTHPCHVQYLYVGLAGVNNVQCAAAGQHGGIGGIGSATP